MKKRLKLEMLLALLFLVVGCTSTQTGDVPQRTNGERVAYMVDLILANSVYRDTGFGVGEEFSDSKTKSKKNSVATTQRLDGNTITSNTVSKERTKTRKKSIGYNIGY